MQNNSFNPTQPYNCMHLDIYQDPWIQCKLAGGYSVLYGIRDCLIHAAGIKEVSIPHPNSIAGQHQNSVYMDDITPFVLMEMILVRVFAPDSEDDKLDIWETGAFDIEAVDQYIENCKAKGISFDVFDKDRPFLQVASERLETTGADKKPLGNIQPTIPAGHSLAFYHCKRDRDGKAPEDIHALTPAEYTAALIRNQMFRTPAGAGYIPSGSVIGEPPLFILTKGRNLFETLLLSMHVEPSAEIRKKDRPMWEWGQYSESIPRQISEKRFGYLASTLNPVVYLRYGDIQDGLIRNVFLKPIKVGEADKPQQYNEQFLLCSTNYAVQMQTDKSSKQESLSAVHMQTKGYSEPWYSLASMCVDVPYKGGFFTSLEAVRFIQELRDEGLVEKNRRFVCEIYGLSMITSTYTSGAAQCKTKVVMPEELLTDQDGRRKIGALVQMIRDASQSLRRALEACDKESKSRDKTDKNYSCTKICSDIPRLFLSDETDKALKPGGYLDQLAEATGAELPDSVTKEIWKDMMQAYDSVSIPIKYLAIKEKNRPVLRDRG